MATYRALERQSKSIVEALIKFSDLDKKLVDKIFHYARCLSKEGSQAIDESIFTAQLMRHFNLSDITMIAYIYRSLRYEISNDIRLIDFCRCICTFLSRNQQMRSDFVFHVYDLNGDGVLTYDEIYRLLKPTVRMLEATMKDDNDDVMKDLTEIVMKALSNETKQTTTIVEFRNIVRINPLILEILGPVLPSPSDSDRFRDKLNSLTVSQVKSLFAYERFQSFSEMKDFPDSLYPFVLDLP